MRHDPLPTVPDMRVGHHNTGWTLGRSNDAGLWWRTPRRVIGDTSVLFALKMDRK